MLLKKLNQPITVKSVLVTTGLLLLAVGVFWGGRTTLRWLSSGPRSPGEVKSEIRRFIKKQTQRSDFNTAPFDFDLKAKLTLMHTNLGRLRQEVSLLSTNLQKTAAEARKLRTDSTTLVEQERSLRQECKTMEAATLERQQRLTNRMTEVSLMESNVARIATNVAVLTREVVDLQSATVNLTNEISSLLTNIAALTAGGTSARTNAPGAAPDSKQELAALQKNVAAKQKELAATRRQFVDKQADLTLRERSLAAARTGLTTAQTSLSTTRTNVSALLNQLTAKRTAWETRQKELASTREAHAAKTKEVASLQEQLAAKTKEVQELNRTLLAKQQDAGTQMAQFRRDMTKKVNEASTYEGIYFTVGQQLFVADKLLASKDPIEQQQALSLAIEAAQHAGQGAEQHWLAARICEAYLLPNLALADARGRIGYTPEAILTQCTAAFERAEELPNVIRTLQTSLDRIGTNAPLRADSVRYQLGYALERSERLDEALRRYKGITENTNLFRPAETRAAIVEEKIRQQKAAKK